MAEARLARGLGGLVEAGGGDAAGAEIAARRLVTLGVDALLSFGLAGGLAPNLAAGAIVIPRTVADENGTIWRTDTDLAARYGPPCGTILAADAIYATHLAKQAAWTASGAVAVDLESGAVARVAAEHGLPFAVLRAVCDPAGRDLPHAALTALDRQGRIQISALFRSVARHPGQIPALVALGREASKARQALLECVRTASAMG